MNPSPSPHTKRLYRLQFVLLCGFLIIFAGLFYWSSLRGGTITAREDNPRLVEAELRIARGEILDRRGVVLARSVPDENGRYTRQYPFTGIGPAVGYYNFRHGTSGAEAAFDELLRGDPVSAVPEWRRHLLHEPQTGFDIQLSIDAALQSAASQLLSDYNGALLIIDIPSGAILTLVSHPGYDPNNLEANFDALNENPTAPLLNRPLQGNYQPGRVLQPFLIAQALDQNLIGLNDPVANISLPLPIDGQVERCLTSPPEGGDWRAVVQHRCPYPMFPLADRMGEAGLQRFYERFGFTFQPAVLEAEEAVVEREIRSAGLAAIGQDEMTVTPLQLAWAWGTLLNDGVPLYPQLVTAAQDENGAWQPLTKPANVETTTSAATARVLRELLTKNDKIMFTIPVLSGPDGDTNTWVLGAAPAANPTTMLVMLLENFDDWQAGEQLGKMLLEMRGE